MNELTDRELIKNDLLTSGYTTDEVETLTKHLDCLDGPLTAEWMSYDIKLEVAQSLSVVWLVHRLRTLSEGSDSAVAVAALEQLVKISTQTGVLLKSDLVFNNLS